MRFPVVLGTVALVAASPPFASPQPADTKNWLEDLAVLANELPRRHVAPETERPVSEFAADVGAVRSRLPAMSRGQIVVEFARLAASFGDSHTEVSLAQAAAGFRRLPLGLYFFGNELRVIAVDTALFVGEVPGGSESSGRCEELHAAEVAARRHL